MDEESDACLDNIFNLSERRIQDLYVVIQNWSDQHCQVWLRATHFWFSAQNLLLLKNRKRRVNRQKLMFISEILIIVMVNFVRFVRK